MLTIVWIERAAAQLIHFSRIKMERRFVRTSDPDGLHLATTDELPPSGHILIAGPGVAKYNFLTFLREHHPLIGRRILATETVADPNDAVLADLARRHLERLPA